MYDFTVPSRPAVPQKKTPWLSVGLLALGAAALFVRSKTVKAEAQTPPAGQFIEVEGVRLHYIERGSGQPIVLLHGNGALVQDFICSGLFDALARNHRVIAFDRPGFGYSGVPGKHPHDPAIQAVLIHAALRRIGVEQPLGVGHSWGTMVAIEMALAKQDEIGGLVLIGGYYYPTPRLDVPMMSATAAPVIGPLLTHTVAPLTSHLLWRPIVRKLFRPAPVAPTFAGWPKWMALRPSQYRSTSVATTMMIPSARRLKPRYGELRLPLTIIAGAGDAIVNTAVQSVKLHEAVPHSVLITVPGAGHMVHHTEPGLALEAITDAAAKVASPVPLLARDAIHSGKGA